jgi:F0F1-type ATP synthase assembly protein I
VARQSSWKATYRYGNIGLELVLSIVVGFLLGRWLDRRFFGAHGYGTVVGTMVGVYTGFRALYKLARQAQREAEEEEEHDRVKADKDAKVEAYKREVDADDEKQ